MKPPHPNSPSTPTQTQTSFLRIQEMKQVWSPERASKAYLDAVKSTTTNFRESGVPELISALAAGWNAHLIVETWSHGGPIPTSVGLAIASKHTGGRHVCIVPDERSRSEYAQRMRDAGVPAPEILAGEPEEVMDVLIGIDFLVVDGGRKEFPRVLRVAKLSCNGGAVLCKNANYCNSKFGSIGSRRVVRSVFLPVGKGLEMAQFSATGSNGSVKTHGHRWIKHVDRQSGDVHFIRT
ncbi:hypothetical protein RJT34_05445 [Clitoria ternatea]|uniref:S-adenosyl-L-methionine-dependent methyltransferase n=1 Tax=Clitoria ternatea TaxID=43366 RepID=A0AAN9K2P4_CLITE